MSLTIEQQKKIADFAGWCWHDLHRQSSGFLFCNNCGDIFRTIKESETDLADWRVVGRLVEKIQTHGLNLTLFQSGGCRLFDLKHLTEILIYDSATPQEAICRAVLAYLEES